MKNVGPGNDDSFQDQFVGPGEIFLPRIYVESLGLTSTTSQTFQTKLTLNTGDILADRYKLTYAAFCGAVIKSKTTVSRILFDGAPIELCDYTNAEMDSWASTYAGFIELDLAAGIHTFIMQFAVANEADTSTIRDAKMLFERVGLG